MAYTHYHAHLDGNGGPEAAEFVSRNMFDVLLGEYRVCQGDLDAALKRAFANIDNSFARLGVLHSLM